MNNVTVTLTAAQIKIIGDSPLFIDDDGSILSEFLLNHSLNILHCIANEGIVFNQSNDSYLGIVLSGKFRVTAENLSISILSAGDLFGAASLYSDKRSTATSITSEVDSSMLLLPAKTVDSLIAQYPLIRSNYLCYLTGRIQFLSGRLRALGATTAEGKLARYLLSTSGEISCTATELAERIGVGRATLYRCLSPLEDERIISRTGRTIKILDYERLSDYT